MPFTPVQMHKDGRINDATSAREYWQLVWDGWTPNGPAPEAPAFSSRQQAALSATIASDVSTGRVLYVTADGNDSRNGKSWSASKATIQAAVDALLGGQGGTIYVGAGTFAPFFADATASNASGIRIVGTGDLATIVAATGAGQDAAKFKSDGTLGMTSFVLENMKLTGTATTGWGLNIGAQSWNQIGRFVGRNLRIENNGAGGVLAFDINDCLFDTVCPDDNYGPAWRITGRAADGTDTVRRGNTCVWLNCRTQGRDDRSTNGYEFLDVGNSWSIIGGEVSFCAKGLVVTSSGGENGLSLTGVHFENNVRAAEIGDNAASGSDAMATFRTCYFNSNATAGGTEDVFLNGAQRTRFEDCQFGAGTVTLGIKESTTRASRYTVDNCDAGSGTLIRRSDGTNIASVNGRYQRNQRIRIEKSSTQGADAFDGAVYVKDESTGNPILLRGGNSSGFVDLIVGNGSPEGTVTANAGSLYLRRAGGVGQTVYYKHTGTGNTGWAEFSPGAPRPLLVRTGVNYSLQATDHYLISNVAAATTHTLPAPSATGIGAGKTFIVKNATTAGGTLTVATAGGTIDGVATDSIAVGASMTYVSDGTNYHKIT